MKIFNKQVKAECSSDNSKRCGRLTAKALLTAFVLLALLAACASVQAAEHSEEPYNIVAYNVDIDVAENNVFSITEDIDVYFNEERHGIYRRIPTENSIERADGSQSVMSARVDNIYCSDNYEESSDSGDVVLQIGDADETIAGDKHYTISYDYTLGQDIADGFDELYFNIIGNGWDTYIDGVTFSIEMPKEFDPEKVGFSTGSYGTVGTDTIEYYVDGLEISGFLTEELNPGEAFTVRIELEDGYFYFDYTAYIIRLCAMVVIPLICLLIIFIFWFKFGRDKKLVSVVEFYPPEGMSSADVSYWYNGRVVKKNLVALLIELANEGYVAINDNEGSNEGEYTIERIKPYPEGLDENKKLFFDGLFESGKDVVTSADLKNKFYNTLNSISSNYGASKSGMRVHTLISSRMKVLSWAMIMASIIINFLIMRDTLGGSEKLFTFIIGLLVLVGAFLLSRKVEKRTEQSHEYLEKISGFKMFLETAEKSRLEALVYDDPKYFYNILPYAYVLGVSDKWVEKFNDITIEPPEWYGGREDFNSTAMWYTMSRTLNDAARAMSSSPTETSSSGGGGVSGGGSGGGGGSSW